MKCKRVVQKVNQRYTKKCTQNAQKVYKKGATNLLKTYKSIKKKHTKCYKKGFEYLRVRKSVKREYKSL